MKVFTFFLTRIFLRKPLLVVAMLLLLGMANYIGFSTSRTIVSTLEGYEQASNINSPDTYVANLDPESNIDVNTVVDPSIQAIYDRLDKDYRFGLFTDCYVLPLANSRNIEASAAYMNQTYADLNGFKITEGSGLSFNYDLNSGAVIPVLVGKGLASEYPIGKQFSLRDPALEQDVTLEVSGVLDANSSHSNLYALDSKQYYNFSIIIPVNRDFIAKASISFKINGLMDLIVTDSGRREVSALAEYIDQQINAKFNFSSQQENIEFYNEYFVSSMIFLSVISLVLLLVIIVLAVWSSLVGVRLMLREFTINLLVGLSYRKVRGLLYVYYSIMSLIALLCIFAFTSYSRFSSWGSRDASFITLGFAGGLIRMDWLGLLSAFVLDVLFTVIIVFVINWRLRQVPISVGVLQ